MRLIGMLDSPYVRRVAISLDLLGLNFEHESLSVFRDYERFAAINPVVKAPTLVTDEGVVLMDSALILEHLELLAAPERRLLPADPATRARCQRIVGLALAACEKTVQLVYEHELRPPERRHAPWIERVRGQLDQAYRLLEAEIAAPGAWLCAARPMQCDVSAAVAWSFTQLMRADDAPAAFYPRLAAFTARAEALPPFAARPML
jgi:glutathione S-transferase